MKSFLALLLFSTQLQAALNIDLSAIDPSSTHVDRYIAWAKPALPPTSRPPYNFSAFDAVNLSRLSGNAAWCQLATNMVEAVVAKAETDMAAGNRVDIAYDSYLYAGGGIADLSSTYQYCPQVTDAQKVRWGAYAEQTVWNIWNFQQAKWGNTLHAWSGWGTDNPGNNYQYSFLRATMMWGFAKPPGGTDWIEWLRTNKISQLISYYTANGAGGGSREGTGYGMAHSGLFALYRLWRDNTPEHQDLANTTLHLRDSVDYLIHATMPDFKRFAPIGDLSRVSYPWLYDYHRCYMIQARLQAPEQQTNRATWWLDHITPSRMGDGFNFGCGLYDGGESAVAPTELYHHSTSAGHLFSRDSWSDDAMWLGFIAGKFDESHAAHDQGSFTLFRGDFLAVTQNIFSHSGIHQEPEVQNVIRFEKAGTTLLQRRNRETTMAVAPGPDGAISATANLSPFYVPSDGVQWSRTLTAANKTVEIVDVLSLASGTTAVWQINTPSAPVKISDNSYRAGGLLITVLAPANPQISVVSWNALNAAEYAGGGYKLEIRGGTTEYRVMLDATEAPSRSIITPLSAPAPSASPIGLTAITGDVWVDDALPAAATPQVENDAWNWVTQNPAPFSGTKAHQSNLAAGIHQHYFSGAATVMPLAAGDILVTYVYLDPVNTPTEIMLQFNDGSSWERRAYWGADNIPWGTNKTNSRRRIGDLPPAGQWVRLEVPAKLIGLEGKTLRGMAYTLFDGRATWDMTGRAQSLAQLQQPPLQQQTLPQQTLPQSPLQQQQALQQPLRIGSVNNRQVARASQFAIAVRDSNNALVSSASNTKAVDISGTIFPQNSDSFFTADVFVVALTPIGWFMRTVDGTFVPWNGDISSLVPAYEDQRLIDQLRANIFSGKLPVPGTYQLYVAYMRTDSSELIYTATPGTLSSTGQ